MAKRVIFVHVLMSEAEFGLRCDVCGHDGVVRIPVLSESGVSMMENCLTCLRRKREDRGPQANSTTGVRGVSRHSDGKYQVSVKTATRQVYGGLYFTLEEADRAARELRNALFTHNDVDRLSPDGLLYPA